VCRDSPGIEPEVGAGEEGGEIGDR